MRMTRVESSSWFGMRVRAAVLLALFAVSAMTAAAGYAREPIAPAALAALTGIDRAFDEVVGSLAEQGEAIAAEGDAIGDKETFAATWRKAAEATFAPAKLKAAFATRIAGKFTAEDSHTIEDFYRSDLGRRLVAAEVAATSIEAQQKMLAEAKELMEGLVKAPGRQAALDRVSRAIKLEDMSVNLALNVSRAMLIGLATTGTSAQAMSMEEILEALEQQRPQIAAETNAMSAISLAYAYRDLPVADIEAYAAFLETPAGVKYSDAVLKGLDAVLSEAGLAFGRALSGGLKQQPI